MRDHISVSQINLYLMCPLKYRYQYVDQLPRPFKAAELAFGSAIHSAIEWWHKERQAEREREWQQVASVFEADMNAQAVDEIRYKNGDDLSALVEKGKELLAVYLKEFKGGAPKAVEQAFRVPLVDSETGERLDLPLDGYFDLLEEGDTIVELKTAAKAYDTTTLAQHLQLTAYAYAFTIQRKREPNLRIDILTKTKKPQLHSFEVVRGRNDIIRFFHLAKRVIEGIQNGHFYPNAGWQCPSCEYYDACQKWRG